MKTLLIAVLVSGALGLFSGTPGAHAQGSVPTRAAENGDLWFVELTGAPTADGASLPAVRNEKAAFRRAAAAAGINYTERRAFDVLFNGFSVLLSPADRLKMARLDGVKSMYPVAVIVRPRPEMASGAAPDLVTALAMTGAGVAQNSLGYTGAGVKVAVVDSGIDYDHPDLGGCFGPGCRVMVGHDFVGDDFNADEGSPGYNPVPAPDDDPDDCDGHGTHVAGIIGANGAVKGVAPGVTFGAYRVFGCEGSTTGDVIIAAMERALADGMQVLNMSLGSSYQWPQYPTAQASDRLVNKGVVVVAAIGNSGASGLYSAGAPGVGKKVIGVASFDNTHVTLRTFAISPDGIRIGYDDASGAPPAPGSGSLPMARTGTTTTDNDACNPLPAGSLAGTATLIRRGACSFYQKAFNAAAAGAAAVVIYNNVSGRINVSVEGTPAITIPVVTISDTEGALIDGRIASGAVTMTWTGETGKFPNPTGGLISSFSSYGAGPDLRLKPNLGAPGGLIYSTYPLELGGHATLSGTSMSSPHVAGGVALMLQARPKTPSNGMMARLQNSADPAPWWGDPGLGFLDNVHRQGAGMLDIPGMILAATLVEPSELALGESQSGPATRTLTIKNSGPAAVSYELSHVAAVSTGPNTFVPSFTTSNATAAFSAPTISVPAGGTASVDITITPPGAPDRGQYGGYIVLTSATDPGDVYRVPYAGFIGDYQSIAVLTPTGFGFPWLAQREGEFYFNRPEGATYTMAGNDIPFVLLHLDHQSRRVRIEAFDAATGKAWHRVSDDEYLARNSTADDFFAFAWDGKTTAGKKTYTVPNGQYVVKVSVLKALGDDNDPTHWETWTSPVITIARP